MRKWHRRLILSRRSYARTWNASAPVSISISLAAGTDELHTKFNTDDWWLILFFHCRYFPKGGGLCKVHTKPVSKLYAAEIVEFGDVKNFFGWSFVAGTLPQKLANETAAGAKQALQNIQHNKPINIETYKESPDVARDNCSGIM